MRLLASNIYAICLSAAELAKLLPAVPVVSSGAAAYPAALSEEVGFEVAEAKRLE